MIKALPRMTWALWLNETNRGGKAGDGKALRTKLFESLTFQRKMDYCEKVRILIE
jgi:hypothetical protein